MEAEDSENELSEGRYAKIISDLKSQLTQQENRVSELETEVEEYKKGSAEAVLSDTGSNNNEDQVPLEDAAFMETTSSTASWIASSSM